MGYRVGFNCFDTEREATDYQMSHVAPTIISDGSLRYPIKKNDVWMYAEQEVKLSFAECDRKADFKEGQQIAFELVGLFALAFMFKFVVKFIYASFWLEVDVQERNSE